MIAYTDQLDQEFRRLGFINGREIMTTAEKAVGQYYCFEVTPTNETRKVGFDGVLFVFVIREPDTPHSPYIRLILATSYRKRYPWAYQRRPAVIWTGGSGQPANKQAIIYKIHQLEKCRFSFAPATMTSLVLGRVNRMQGRNRHNRPGG